MFYTMKTETTTQATSNLASPEDITYDGQLSLVTTHCISSDQALVHSLKSTEPAVLFPPKDSNAANHGLPRQPTSMYRVDPNLYAGPTAMRYIMPSNTFQD